MPIVSVPSDSRRTHSWLSVERKASRTIMKSPSSSGHQDLAVADKRRLDDARRKLLVADRDLDGIADSRRRGQACERDRALEGRRKCSARDLAVARRRANHLMRAEHTARIDKEQTEQAAVALARCKRRLPDEVAR